MQAYLTAGPTIASLPAYLVPLAEHLLHNKLLNWDAAVRELAAEALAALVPLQPQYFARVALPAMLERTLGGASVEARHGALLATAALTAALASAGLANGGAAEPGAIVRLALDVQAQQLTKGKSGELMCVALCALIGAIGRLRLDMSDAQVWSKIASDDLAACKLLSSDNAVTCWRNGSALHCAVLGASMRCCSASCSRWVGPRLLLSRRQQSFMRSLTAAWSMWSRASKRLLASACGTTCWASVTGSMCRSGGSATLLICSTQTPRQCAPAAA